MAELNKRHADPTLLAVEQLYGSLQDHATADEIDGLWPLALKIEASIDHDARASKSEHTAMRRVREKISEVYGDRNRGHRMTFEAARMAVLSLQGLLESRTTGFDGHRLR
jgi:hypothetical protein